MKSNLNDDLKCPACYGRNVCLLASGLYKCNICNYEGSYEEYKLIEKDNTEYDDMWLVMGMFT